MVCGSYHMDNSKLLEAHECINPKMPPLSVVVRVRVHN